MQSLFPLRCRETTELSWATSGWFNVNFNLDYIVPSTFTLKFEMISSLYILKVIFFAWKCFNYAHVECWLYSVKCEFFYLCPVCESLCRSSHGRFFMKKNVHKNFLKFLGKHLCRSFFPHKVAGLTLQHFFYRTPPGDYFWPLKWCLYC